MFAVRSMKLLPAASVMALNLSTIANENLRSDSIIGANTLAESQLLAEYERITAEVTRTTTFYF